MVFRYNMVMRGCLSLLFALLCVPISFAAVPLVILDIGHSTKDRGASSPDGKLTETAAGWLNALDDAGIPSAVIEALYVNNRTHATYLLTDAGGTKVAQTVAHGILAWLKARANSAQH